MCQTGVSDALSDAVSKWPASAASARRDRAAVVRLPIASCQLSIVNAFEDR